MNDNIHFVESIPYYVALGVSYLGGLAIYLKRVPEKYYPKVFDYLVELFLFFKILKICLLFIKG